MAATEKKYQLGTTENQEFLQGSKKWTVKFRTSVPVNGRKLLLSWRRWNSLERPEPRDLDHKPYGTCLQHWFHIGT